MNCYTLETLSKCFNPRETDLINYDHLINCSKCLTLIDDTTKTLVGFGFMSSGKRLAILENVKFAKQKARENISCDIANFYYKDSKEKLSLSKLVNRQVVDLIIVPDSEYSIKAYYVVFSDGTKVDLFDGDTYVSFRKLGLSEKFGEELYKQWRENIE